MNTNPDSTRQLPHDPVSALPSAAVNGYTASQELDILCEVLKNITSGTTHIHQSNFDHAALCLEVAASKLRSLENSRRCNNTICDTGNKE